MNPALVDLVYARAGWMCEYCRLPAILSGVRFEIEHIIPRQHGGRTVEGNLALACLHCNKFKGPNLSGIDGPPSRLKIVRLFHPRLHRWPYHLRWDGPYLVGRTAIGRVTVKVLAMTDEHRVGLRRMLIAAGWGPPA